MKDYQAEYDADRRAIADALANGFMDCKAVRDGLGWDQPKTNGSYYSSTQTAYRWIEDSGEEVVYILPDGGMYYIDGERVTISKAERTGVYPDVFAHVLAYKESYYAKRRHEEWTANMDSAVKAREREGAQTKNMDWDVYIDSLGPEPPAPEIDVAAVRRAAMERREAEHDAATIADLRAYKKAGLPLNRRGLPKSNPLRVLTGRYIARADVRRLWPQVQTEALA